MLPLQWRRGRGYSSGVPLKIYPSEIRAEAKWAVGMTSVTAEGRFVVTSLFENLSDRFAVGLFGSGAGCREYFEAKPESRIVAVPSDGGPAQEVHKDRNWIGYTLASPTQGHLVMFRHV